MRQIKMSVESLRQSPVNNRWVLMLRDEAERHYLPVYMGEPQANLIREELVNSGSSKPSDASLAGVDFKVDRLESVTIDRFRDGIFHAKLLLDNDKGSREMECQTAQAIALALRDVVPILVNEMVLEKAELKINVR